MSSRVKEQLQLPINWITENVSNTKGDMSTYPSQNICVFLLLGQFAARVKGENQHLQVHCTLLVDCVL